MRMAGRLAALGIACVLGAGACVTGGQIRTTASVVDEDIKLAREQGALKCAPKELAIAEANLTFTLGELKQGNWVRARQHVEIAEEYAKKAVQLSKGCKKQVLIKKEKPPPKIIKIEEKDTDGDGLLDNVDKCPQDPEDPDGFEDDDGCPDDDNDQDGVPDAEDRCPVTPGVVENQGCPEEAPMDTDGDGITDDVDKCVEDPEDKDGFEDTDGCPDPDNDQDGVVDGEDGCPMEPGPVENKGCPVEDKDGDGLKDPADACPEEPEDKDGFEDTDGCPDLDNDGDGIPDVTDKCPMEAGIPETDGCPPKDRDGDGVPDHEDRCPDEPGVKEEQGCPKKYKLVELKKDKIEIKQKVYFDTAKWTIKPVSYPLLNEVAQVLKDHPTIKIRIEGHTDSRGRDAYNLRLSQKRAEAVRDYLIQQGIDPSRLEAVGFGETRPIASNATAVGREANRRVEFVITER